MKGKGLEHSTCEVSGEEYAMYNHLNAISIDIYIAHEFILVHSWFPVPCLTQIRDAYRPKTKSLRLYFLYFD